jgi:hypothetical protein
MRKSLTTICAALLVAGLAACNRGGDNASDEARLNAAAAQQDNAIYDTSPDDMSANAGDVDAGDGNAAAPANTATTNVAAPGNATAR